MELGSSRIKPLPVKGLSVVVSYVYCRSTNEVQRFHELRMRFNRSIFKIQDPSRWNVKYENIHHHFLSVQPTILYVYDKHKIAVYVCKAVNTDFPPSICTFLCRTLSVNTLRTYNLPSTRTARSPAHASLVQQRTGLMYVQVARNKLRHAHFRVTELSLHLPPGKFLQFKLEYFSYSF